MYNKRLILEDGTVFEGYSFGAKGEIEGEIILNTAMAGYEKTLTDPSNEGKVMLFTYPLIGNYGMNSKDFKNSKKFLKGMIVKEVCEKPSNFTSEYTLDEVLKELGIVGIYGLDTRSLSKKIRDKKNVKIRIMDI